MLNKARTKIFKFSKLSLYVFWYRISVSRSKYASSPSIFLFCVFYSRMSSYFFSQNCRLSSALWILSWRSLTFSSSSLRICCSSSVSSSSSEVKFYTFMRMRSSLTFCFELYSRRNFISSLSSLILFSYFVKTFYWSISTSIFLMQRKICSSHDFSVTLSTLLLCWLKRGVLGLYEEWRESYEGYWISELFRILDPRDVDGLTKFFKVSLILLALFNSYCFFL